jgi:hypothetical protein
MANRKLTIRYNIKFEQIMGKKYVIFIELLHEETFLPDFKRK